MQLIDQVRPFLELLREQRSVEYKRSEPWETLKLKIVRTALGMANIRDGGIIIVGVAQETGRLIAKGMEEAHLATYKADDVQATVNRFADPFVRVEVDQVEWDGRTFVTIAVREFDEVPVVCKNNSGTSLRLGAVYTRPYRMPETCEVQSQTEMREIIDMAVEKGVRRFLAAAQRVGLPILSDRAARDAQAFNDQLGDL